MGAACMAIARADVYLIHDVKNEVGVEGVDVDGIGQRTPHQQVLIKTYAEAHARKVLLGQVKEGLQREEGVAVHGEVAHSTWARPRRGAVSVMAR